MSNNVYIAGHNGMVGKSIYKRLSKDSNINLVTSNRENLDLTNQSEVNAFFNERNIDLVYLAAAKVGGIHANNEYPVDFLYENMMIQFNIIKAAYESNVSRLLFLGSSCIYPKFADQPIMENSLLSGKLEETNEAYAIAKISGIKLCESYNKQHSTDFRCVMPTNLYGPGDNYHPKNSHVIPALIQRFHKAKINNDKRVVIWGSGNPKREFMYVEDLADACIFIMNLKSEKIPKEPPIQINIGTGKDCTIKELAEVVKDIIGYSGMIEFDTSMPDGTPRKLLDVSKINKLGWHSKTSLSEGIAKTYGHYLDECEE